jgi:sulfatase-like protein
MKPRPIARPFFLILLPVFFVFHGFVQNARFVSWSDCLRLTGYYCLAALLLYLLFYLFLKNGIKAALAASFVMAFYLFFGYFHEFLWKHSIFLHHYSIILPLFVLLTVAIVRYLRKKRTPLTRLSLFLNVLLLLYIVADGIGLALHRPSNASAGISVSPLLAGRNRKCDTCARPDIYLLIFDEYSGSRTLRQAYHYDNSGLDSFLRSEHFHLQPDSRSNYFITPFSMASMLNLSYLQKIPDPLDLQADDYNNVLNLLRHSEAANFLISRGYEVVNLSPFDLPEHPSRFDQPFIATRTKLISFRTLTDCIVRDMGAWLTTHLFSSRQVQLNGVAMVQRTNDSSFREAIRESTRQTDVPRFIYTHLLMPHAPYLFAGLRRRSVEEDQEPLILQDYLNYLPYTNLHVRQLITAIKKNTGGRAIILFMSDHGLRYMPGTPVTYMFRDQNAVYFPDQNYAGLYDSISNVNQFRVVFNKLFHLDLPLLKDSAIILVDKR